MRRQATPLQYALTSLGKKDYSVNDLRIRMTKKGYTDTEIEETINRLTEWGYLNDKEYTRRRLERFMAEERSRNYIQFKLEQSGVSPEIIAEELNRNYPAETERKILIKRWQRLHSAHQPTWKEKVRWARKMLSAGFPVEEVQELLERGKVDS